MTNTSLPLSLSQLEVWRDQRAWPGSAHLNLGGTAFFEGPLDLLRLRRALTQLVAENAVLRLVLRDDGTQLLLSQFEPELQIIDFSDQAQPRDAMRQWWQDWMRQPFALTDAPPWRFALLRASNTLHGGTIQFHHLIMDGWGTTQVMRRWSEIYNSIDEGTAPAPPQPDLSYLKFIEESLAYRDSEAFARDAAFWRAQVPHLAPPLFQRRHAGARRENLAAAHLVVETITRADYDRLNQYAASLHITPFNFFLAAIALVFAQDDAHGQVLIGVPSLNRGGRRYRDTMGMFVGVMGIPVAVDPDMTAAALVAAVGATMRSALRHSRYPLSELARALEVARAGREGLFDVLLSFERQDYQVSFGDAELVESRQLFSGTARYPLGITVCEFHARQDLELVLEASDAYFSREDAAQLAARIWRIVQMLAGQPDIGLGEIALLSEAERAHIVIGRHTEVICHPNPGTCIAAFERHVASRPEATCLVWDGGQMDYRTVNARAHQLAQRLRDLHAGPGRIVAVAMQRSPDLVVAMLAIAKAGAAFLPLDPDAPVARLAAVLQDSAALALLVQQHDWDRLAPLHTQTMVGGWAQDLDVFAPCEALAVPASGDLAYVLFTSGSTGRPKGVMVAHGTLMRRMAWLTREWGVTAQDRAALATQATFDPSLIEWCLPLVNGACIALAPPGRLRPQSLAEFALRHKVTIMAFVPSTLAGFLDVAADASGLALRVACCGGEVLAPELARRYLGGTRARLFNVYGPTEACIFATAWECRRDSDATVLPVGRPVDDTRIYVLNSRLQPVPDGIAGEVFIGGSALAGGYLHRTELTQAAFIDDPFVPGQRMYRTGDSGWLDHDGCLHFLGRLDRQVKLRGYRIELGEIEAALLAIEGVTQAAACKVELQGQPVIHAWVAGTALTDHERLQRALRVRLPDYMLPSAIALLPQLPVTGSGKIDYDALPPVAPSLPIAAGRGPANQREADLLALWESELGRKSLSVQDNFFDVGGDSLAAISILAGAERLLQRRIPLYMLTENPTVERLAAALDLQVVQPGILVPLSAGLTGNTIFLAASGHGDLLRFQTLARALDGVCDLVMLQPPTDKAFKRIKDLAAMYADAVQAHGGGPALVAGFSIGGIAALETARLLEQRGSPVRGLVLIDTVYPKAVWGGTFYWRLFSGLVRLLRLQELSINGRRLGAMVKDAGLVSQVMAMGGYRVAAIVAPTTLIKTSGLLGWERPLFGSWKKLIGENLQERRVAGLHGSIFGSSQVGDLAVVLTDALRGAR
ncbi:MAG TPA: amino acid adenylation domain-containing protein [Burkholderiaceae bacterium]|nr:amino acid adenylation domain-containing protein [Burkholderiaceae bacterium]